MRVLLIAPQADPLERELAALGLELTHEDAGAEGLVTVAPRVELEPLSGARIGRLAPYVRPLGDRAVLRRPAVARRRS